MATAREIRSLIEQTTTGTRRRRVPEEVKEHVRRYAARRRAQGSSWEAIGRETGLLSRGARRLFRDRCRRRRSAYASDLQRGLK